MVDTILEESSLGAGASTSLSDSNEVKITEKGFIVAFAAEAIGDANCNDDVRVHLRGSLDGNDYSTVDIGDVQTGYFDIPVSDDAGNLVRSITATDFSYNYIKVIAENLDTTYTSSDVVVKADVREQYVA